MSKYLYKRIAVKVGSNVLSTKEGYLDLTRIQSLVNQISNLKKDGIEVVLISSGAVASGRNVIIPTTKLDIVDQRQLYSAVGQTILINHYLNFFKDNGLLCGQVLTTKEDFSSRKQYLNQRNCIEIMLSNNVVPIINENDTTSLSELMFTDNDELSGLIASMIDADTLIILSNIDGIYNGNPDNPESKVIKEIAPNNNISKYIQSSKSRLGRGGMNSKYKTAKKVANEGITVYIANGSREHILTDILDKDRDVICTKFISGKKTSAIKKWMAHTEDFSKGKIYVNENCEKAITSSENISSILPIGVIKSEGRFLKGDVISIVNQEGVLLGVGKVQYDNITLKTLMGHKGKRAIIHYDYLYINK